MKSIKDFTDEELAEQITNAQEDLDSAEYGSGDYNTALAELQVATGEAKQRGLIKEVEEMNIYWKKLEQETGRSHKDIVEYNQAFLNELKSRF